jgi:amphi-Trp domain-containing protein
MTKKRARDIEKGYGRRAFAAKLRRLADAIESGGRFSLQVAGERIYVPVGAVFNVEHERSGGEEEIEFQLKWQSGQQESNAVATSRRPSSRRSSSSGTR